MRKSSDKRQASIAGLKWWRCPFIQLLQSSLTPLLISLAGTSLAVVVDVNIDRVVKVSAVFLSLFLCKCVPCDDYTHLSLVSHSHDCFALGMTYSQRLGRC